jgi:RNA polymerase sigma-70 factor (ECF subfamily)
MEMARTEVVSAGMEAAQAERLAAIVTDHYERRGKALWGLARRLGASEDQAGDVVQEAHVRLWRELLNGTAIVDLDAWSFRVTYRLVMDHHRLGRRIRELAGRLADVRTLAMSHALDEALSLWPLVDKLPHRERVTLYLRYRADLSFEQIGEVMGITAASARAYSSRAIERLREALSSAPEGDRHA